MTQLNNLLAIIPYKGMAVIILTIRRDDHRVHLRSQEDQFLVFVGEDDVVLYNALSQLMHPSENGALVSPG